MIDLPLLTEKKFKKNHSHVMRFWEDSLFVQIYSLRERENNRHSQNPPSWTNSRGEGTSGATAAQNFGFVLVSNGDSCQMSIVHGLVHRHHDKEEVQTDQPLHYSPWRATLCGGHDHHRRHTGCPPGQVVGEQARTIWGSRRFRIWSVVNHSTGGCSSYRGVWHPRLCGRPFGCEIRNQDFKTCWASRSLSQH